MERIHFFMSIFTIAAYFGVTVSFISVATG